MKAAAITLTIALIIILVLLFLPVIGPLFNSPPYKTMTASNVRGLILMGDFSLTKPYEPEQFIITNANENSGNVQYIGSGGNLENVHEIFSQYNGEQPYGGMYVYYRTSMIKDAKLRIAMELYDWEVNDDREVAVGFADGHVEFWVPDVPFKDFNYKEFLTKTGPVSSPSK